ncbi:MAG: fumarylacetoacetase [Thermoleophilaceae bacterium]|jgi:fumarylacetoacetase|nr:fumarylacetoacetase [Thermoleophilaceae bacterium]
MAADGRFVARTDSGVVEVPGYSSLDELLAQSPADWLRAMREVASTTETVPEPELALPFTVGDYVDFYSSLEHASFFGRLFRPDGDPLPANWRRMPLGYHGRASTVVVSGTRIRRPMGQTPDYEPTRALDIEVELGFVVGGPPNPLGSPIPIADAGERIFGVVLLNDWSARDIQRYETQPLGPFLAKAFATSISPWVIPISELERARVAGPGQEPAPPAHLEGGGNWNFDIELAVEINGQAAATTNARRLYWNVVQQLAHLASGGAIVRPGDLLGTGTISGGAQESGGSLMEMGRGFLDDGDEVVIRGRAGELDLGAVTGTITPAA